MNLTYQHQSSKEGKKEHMVLLGKNCSSFKYRFSKGDYTSGNEENTAFYVYVYDFQPPLLVDISFSQVPWPIPTSHFHTLTTTPPTPYRSPIPTPYLLILLLLPLLFLPPTPTSFLATPPISSSSLTFSS
jgi:hypothetical protein